ncbi:MAG: type II toxin-antitoxin system HipA family toxin [Duncaniella sp.]|nr:type II toxin-antitoxin system HipA family toxin [Duncaniella sp.]MDE6391080.1 type II toxin-antitoxin system HipA family toxin [Duncaniella sp.]
MKKIDSLTVKFRDRTVGTLSLTPDNRQCVFGYDREWLGDGFSISPLELPLRQGVFIAKPMPFNGNFGVFEDSLPDGYGRYLLHKALMREGINDSDLSALDRLAIVGKGGMGGLTFYPSIDILESNADFSDLDVLQTKALEVLGERQDGDAEMLLYNSGNSGGARPKAIYEDADGHWLVKFRHIYDPKDIGKQEYRYNAIARDCGITVPDFKLINGRYFASRRFDIAPDGNRRHTATAGGLLGVSLSNPVLDYDNLLALTGFLTQSPADVEEMYRRMVFNYLMDNKDDHCKNFSFIVVDDSDGGWKWRLAPAYDLTLCAEGYNGEHATSVNGNGSPGLSDFLSAGKKIKISEARCREILDQVKAGCSGNARYKIK